MGFCPETAPKPNRSSSRMSRAFGMRGQVQPAQGDQAPPQQAGAIARQDDDLDGYHVRKIQRAFYKIGTVFRFSITPCADASAS